MHKYCDVTKLLPVTVEASNGDQQEDKNTLEHNYCMNESTHIGDHSSVVAIFILRGLHFLMSKCSIALNSKRSIATSLLTFPIQLRCTS